MNEINYRLVFNGYAAEADAEQLSDALVSQDSSAETSASSSSTKLNPLDWENIKPTLNILWQGLLAIFIVIGIIIAIVSLINFCVGKAESAKKRREDPEYAAREEAEKEEKKRLKAEKRDKKKQDGDEGRN